MTTTVAFVGLGIMGGPMAANEAAREAGVVIPLGAVVAQLLGSLQAQGHGGLDHSALLRLVEQLSGRQGA